MTDIKLGNERLLQLAEILDTADERHIRANEPTYDQDIFAHDCGTPACAAGHWMAAHPYSWDLAEAATIDGRSAYWGLRLEFALDELDYNELFSSVGCGQAKTAKDAAAYIRAFVARRQS